MTRRSRRLPALAIPLALAALVAGSTPLASGQAGLGAQQRAADQLRSVVAAESAKLGTTRAGLAQAEQRLSVLSTRAQTREAQLTAAQQRLLAARAHLSRLQRREAAAKHALAENLLAQYKAGRPQLVSVVLDSTRFADLWQRLEFYKRLSGQNARILGTTRDARAAVAGETKRLQGLWARYSRLTQEALLDRGRADALRNALLEREQAQLARRDSASSRLASVRARIATLQRRQAAAAARAASVSTATAQAPAVRANASGAVAQVIAAANQIASTPYVWGGGHGGASGGYDCSGSVSYALISAGLLSSPLDSTGFMSWGEPGPGAHITVYANAGHAFMIVDGRRFDTSALSGGGTRWTSAGRSTAGFVARHPPGL